MLNKIQGPSSQETYMCSYLSIQKSQPKPLIISCEMPTVLLSTFVHTAPV